MVNKTNNGVFGIPKVLASKEWDTNNGGNKNNLLVTVIANGYSSYDLTSFLNNGAKLIAYFKLLKMEYITVAYKVNSELVDNLANEDLFTITLLEKVKEVYDKVMEQLTPIDISFFRDDNDKTQITIKVKCTISERNSNLNFNVDELINKALKSGKP